MKAARHPKSRTVGWSLLHAARLHRFCIGEVLTEIGLFPGQEQVLQALSASESMTMTELTRVLRVRPPTVSKTVGRLTSLGLVARRTETGDARSVRLNLTERGREAAGLVDGFWDKIENDLLEGLDSKERKRLRRGLQHIAENLVRAIGADERRFDPPEDALDSKPEPAEPVTSAQALS